VQVLYGQDGEFGILVSKKSMRTEAFYLLITKIHLGNAFSLLLEDVERHKGCHRRKWQVIRSYALSKCSQVGMIKQVFTSLLYWKTLPHVWTPYFAETKVG
jgi:hypothetical protein